MDERTLDLSGGLPPTHEQVGVGLPPINEVVG